jgi:hypothetical protein
MINDDNKTLLLAAIKGDVEARQEIEQRYQNLQNLQQEVYNFLAEDGMFSKTFLQKNILDIKRPEFPPNNLVSEAVLKMETKKAT